MPGRGGSARVPGRTDRSGRLRSALGPEADAGQGRRLGMARGEDTHHAAGVVRRALDLGVSCIDTARAYGTEEAVGEGIAGYVAKHGERLVVPDVMTDPRFARRIDEMTSQNSASEC